MQNLSLTSISTLLRYYSLLSTTTAGSGHPTSCLSAADLMAVLFFGNFFRFKIEEPEYQNNDRLIFSKGHAAPLFYALWAVAGKLTEEDLKSLRKIDSPLEGHPTMEFPYTEAASGSLGQGLSIGMGMALNAQYLDKLPYRTWVLLGDSEMAEGSIWEALQLAAHYRLRNLVGILDVNRLGQRGETMYGHHVSAHDARLQAFGWRTYIVDGHDIEAIRKAYEYALHSPDQPTMIIAKTIKGKGVSFLEDQEGWHGKALAQDEFKKATDELGEIPHGLVVPLPMPEEVTANKVVAVNNDDSKTYNLGETIATRKAYGEALVDLIASHPHLVVLDAEVSNSTFTELVKKKAPDRFFEMYIAEQNMVGVGVGLARRGKVPFVSTFSAFLTRAFDQLRMANYSTANLKVCGSHAGVSIGEDGASQMGLEDIALFRSLLNTVVLYPADGNATKKLVQAATNHPGLVYIRTSRPETEIIYGRDDDFEIGGSKVIRSSDEDVVTVVSAGVTLYEALKAYEVLQLQNISIRVIDTYSIQPIDRNTLLRAAKETRWIITVEDHYPAGGLGEAVISTLADVEIPIYQLAVKKIPHSATGSELLGYEEINTEAIVQAVRSVLGMRDKV